MWPYVEATAAWSAATSLGLMVAGERRCSGWQRRLKKKEGKTGSVACMMSSLGRATMASDEDGGSDTIGLQRRGGEHDVERDMAKLMVKTMTVELLRWRCNQRRRGSYVDEEKCKIRRDDRGRGGEIRVEG